MPMSPKTAASVAKEYLPALLTERNRLGKIDRYYRWEHDKPHAPNRSTREYRELGTRAETPWGGLVVTSVAQALYVDGFRAAREADNAAPWAYWQANGLDSRQIAIHRGALAHGLSYATVLPGEDMFGAPLPKIRGVSARRMVTLYEDEVDDDWPMYAVQCDPATVDGRKGYTVRLYDDEAIYRFTCGASGDGLTFVTFETHDVGVCPVVRFANQLDLEGRSAGEIEPFIPVFARIDQTVFDRLVVQRFASWVVRTIAGMTPPEGTSTEVEKLRLRAESILIAEDAETKFGSLPATPLDGFISAHDADVRALAAVSQTPPHHLLGQMANLSAEALAAAEASLSRKVEERKHSFGESWEQVLRLAAYVMEDDAAARDTSAQVRWRDMESRSLAQAADALGKLAQMLGVPVEMLWEKIPGFTDQDVERAKSLRENGDPIAAVLGELAGGTRGGLDPDEVKKRADAMGVLIRSGVDPVAAARQAGLDGVSFTGAVPVSLRLPENDAGQLEQK